MSVFILIAGLITITTLGLLILPLRKDRTSMSLERRSQNIHFAKERLQELEAQLTSSEISDIEYEALKLEIENNLADDIDLSQNDEQIQTENQADNKGLMLILCIALPLLAAGIYTQLGTPEALKTALNNGDINSQPNPQQIEQMLASVEQRLATNPNDPQGWTILSRSYLSLGRFEDAKRSFLKLLEFGGESANVYAQLADTASLITGGSVNEEAKNYIDKALALDSQQPQALWLAGLHAAQNGLSEQASGYWNTLLPLLGHAPQQQQELKTIIQQTIAGGAVINNQSSAQTANAEEQSGPINLNVNVKLTVSVEIAPELSERIDDSDTVFVFARGQNGPPPPLAVKRLRVADLPAKITLSDADAMVPQFKLSLFEDVQVIARVSKSGHPTAQAGDLESLPIKIKNSETKTLELIIGEVVK